MGVRDHVSPDEGQSTTPAPDSPTGESEVIPSETGEQPDARGARPTTLSLAAAAAAAILVVLITLIVANRSAVRVNWLFGDSSVFLAWVVLGAALLGLLLGLLLAVLLRAARSWWFVVAVVVLVAAAAAWFFLLRQEETVAPVVSPSARPSLSSSPLPSYSLSPSPSSSPLPSLSSSPLPSFSPSASPSPVAWAGAWGRIDGVGGGLVVAGTAGAYDVTFYDGALRLGASVPATQGTDGRQLQFTMPSQFSISGPSGPFEATLTLGDTFGTATLTITAANQTTVLIPFRRVPE